MPDVANVLFRGLRAHVGKEVSDPVIFSLDMRWDDYCYALQEGR